MRLKHKLEVRADKGDMMLCYQDTVYNIYIYSGIGEKTKRTTYPSAMVYACRDYRQDED